VGGRSVGGGVSAGIGWTVLWIEYDG